MSFDPKPVTLDEYNQTLRDAVNSYYTHAIDDPSMSQEDTLNSTGEMAERYLGAVEEFQNAQNTQMNMGTENSTGDVQNTADMGVTGTEVTVDNGTETVGSVENGSENEIGSSVENANIDIAEGCEDGMDI